MPEIHPTATVHADADLAEDVVVGPGAIIEADVSIGAGCRIGAYSVVHTYTRLGRNNTVDAHVVLGGLPQDLGFDPDTPTYVQIGDGNTFREFVTINRATTEGGATTIGNDNYWMTGSHAGHDVTVGNNVILANGAMMGGHSTIDDGVVFGGGTAVHQFCHVGERAMFQGLSANSMHVPPYCIHTGVNIICGLNRVGIRRAKHICVEDRRQIKEAFDLLYRRGLSPARALEEMDARDDWDAPARTFVEFIRECLAAEGPFVRGICPLVKRNRR
jgi:UDP-N-acetylglucosamine acyltransferase